RQPYPRGGVDVGLRSRPGVSKRASAAGTKCHHRHRTGEARRVLQPAASDREAGHLPSTWPRHAERLSGSPDRPDRAHFEWQSAPAAACRPRGGVRQPGLFAGSPDLDCSRRAKPSLLGGSLLFRGGPADPAWAGSAPRQLRRARATTDVCRLGAAGELASRLLEAGGAALVVAMLLVLLISQSLTRPLTQLASAAEDIAAGNYSRRVSIKGQDEIGMLGSAFNRMGEAVERARKVQRD